MPELRWLSMYWQTDLGFEDIKFTHGTGGVFQEPWLNAFLMV